MDWGSILGNAAGELISPTTAAYALAAIGLSVHFGYTGLLNFGQAGFMAVGAYAFAISTLSLGSPVWLAILIAIAASVVFAFILGIPTLRLRADYLAIVTIAAAEIVRYVVSTVGLTDITVTDVIDERLETARAFGASRTLNGKDVDVEATMRELTAGEGVPLIVDAACIPALMPQMVRIASAAGRIGLLGFSTTPTDLVQLEMIKKELTLVGSRLNNRKFARVIELIASGKLQVQEMISHRIHFDEMPQAIALIENHPEQTRKVLVQLNPKEIL